MKKNYIIAKGTYNGDITFVDYSKIDGLKITPKNKINYPGVKVDSLIIIKPSFIEKVVKRKIKIKLDYYLKYIANLLDEDDDEGYRQALNSLTRFKDTIDYKYRKHLDDKYIDSMQKRISLLERELKNKIVYKTLEKQNLYLNKENEKEEERRRSR